MRPASLRSTVREIGQNGAPDLRRGRSPVDDGGVFLDRRRPAGRGRAHAERTRAKRDDGRSARRDPDGRIEALAVCGAGDLELSVGAPAHAHGRGCQGGVQTDRQVCGRLEARAGVRQEHDRRGVRVALQPRRRGAPGLRRGHRSGRSQQH